MKDKELIQKLETHANELLRQKKLREAIKMFEPEIKEMMVQTDEVIDTIKNLRHLQSNHRDMSKEDIDAYLHLIIVRASRIFDIRNTLYKLMFDLDHKDTYKEIQHEK